MALRILLTLVFLVGSTGAHRCVGRLRPRLSKLVDCGAVNESLNALSQKLSSQPFSSETVFPGNEAAFVQANAQYASFTFLLKPSFIVLAESEVDVQAAVIFARRCDYAVSARSGGHAYLGGSSCTSSSEEACMVIDVSKLNEIQFKGTHERYVSVGPGTTLDQIVPFLDDHGQFIAAGECAKVAVGGHMQTGGFNLWTRQFGAFATQVAAFRIVLSDGSIRTVTKPKRGRHRRRNDTLFYAVLGGGAGSWGVITEVVLKPFRNEDYFSVYWQVSFAYEVDAVVNMMRHVSELVEENKLDSRWSLWFSLLGTAPLGLPNVFQLEASWVAPIEEGSYYDYTFFQSIVDACTNCDITRFDNKTEPVSFSYRNRHLTIPDGPEFPPPFRYYEKKWQETASYPDPDEMEAIVRAIDTAVPTATNPHLMISQITPAAFPDPNRGNVIALPWDDLVFGVSLDLFFPDPTLKSTFRDLSESVTDTLIASLEEDRRAIWAAYLDPKEDHTIDLERDWSKYFESEDKFRELQCIKECVDPDNIFHHVLSIPMPS